jgi:hypothetical protein
LPPHATEVYVDERSFLDSYQMLRFDAPMEEARTFATAVLGRPAAVGEDPYFTGFGAHHEWWLREYPPNGEGGRAQAPGRIVKLVLQPIGDRARIWMVISAS